MEFEKLEKEKSKELFEETTVFINAGGRGSRLKDVVESHPERGVTKSLLPFADGSLVSYQINRFNNLGFHNVIVGAGDHENVREHVDSLDYSADEVEVVTTETQLGTGGDLITAARTEQFQDNALIHNVDTLLDVDEGDVLEFHNEHGGDATIVLTRRSGVPNENALGVNADGLVVRNREAESEAGETELDEDIAFEASSTGMVIIRTEALREYPWSPEDGPLSLYSDVLGKLYREGKLYGFDNGERFFMDIGTPEQLKKMERHPVLRKILEERSKK